MKKRVLMTGVSIVAVTLLAVPAASQLVDKTNNPNRANEGIGKSLDQQIGSGRGDLWTTNSSAYLIARDPFRSIRRGRQLFQRKFLRSQGVGPLSNDGIGDVETNLAIGAGVSDSCAACHGRPRGSAGFGGDVATRPDSRDAQHLFGLGLKEMLADEITAELRALRDDALARAATTSGPVGVDLASKGISYGRLTAHPDGSVDSSKIEGVDADLRVKPFFAHGATTSIREFIVGAFNDEMGMQAVDPELLDAHNGARFVTPAGMVLDGSKDRVKAPPTGSASDDPDGDGKVNEVPTSVIDHLEFYLLNYFKPATYQQTNETRQGRELFQQIECARCHVPDLVIEKDRRVADVETVYDPARGHYNSLFATASALYTEVDDGLGYPALKMPNGQRFVVRNIFTDFKRHDLGPAFHERDYDGTLRTQFMTTPLWGVGSSAPYGHDGRSINLVEVILRHGGEAEASKNAFGRLSAAQQQRLVGFLQSLVLFPPDDTASNLDPGNRQAWSFPQYEHGSIRLSLLFNDPADPE